MIDDVLNVMKEIAQDSDMTMLVVTHEWDLPVKLPTELSLWMTAEFWKTIPVKNSLMVNPPMSVHDNSLEKSLHIKKFHYLEVAS